MKPLGYQRDGQCESIQNPLLSVVEGFPRLSVCTLICGLIYTLIARTAYRAIYCAVYSAIYCAICRVIRIRARRFVPVESCRLRS